MDEQLEPLIIEADEQEDLEEAIRISNEAEFKKKSNTEKLIEKNLGTYYDGADANFINQLVKETGGASSRSAKANPEDYNEPKGKPGRPRSNQNLREAKGPPTALKPKLPRSRSPSKKSVEKTNKKEIVNEKAAQNNKDKEDIKMRAEEKAEEKAKVKAQAAEDKKQEADNLKA